VNVRYSCIHSRRVAQAEYSRTSFSSRGAIGYSWTASLSLIVPVAEAVPETIVRSRSAIVSAVVGTLTVPVVAPAGTVTVCEVVV
jgi:hypothetical protein